MTHVLLWVVRVQPYLLKKGQHTRMFAALEALLPMWQNQDQFERSTRFANELHTAAINRANEHHKEEQSLEFILHRRSLVLDNELHREEMAHANDIAKREAVRDVWSQKNQLIQTLMIVDTLMFSCAAAVFCEGDIPESTPVELVRLYAFFLGAALTLLFVSVWFSLKLQGRMAHYDMHKPKLVYICDKTHVDFSAYFECHCRLLERVAFATFYLGTAFTIASGCTYTASAFQWQFEVLSAAATFVALSVITIVVVVAGYGFWLVSEAEGDQVAGLSEEPTKEILASPVEAKGAEP